MEKIYIKARGKVNLTLNILEKRTDNYHNLKSVFQKINLYDEIYLYKNKVNNLKINCNMTNLAEKDNIIYKAYMKLKEKFDFDLGVNVVLKKKIPMEAGLAGGSTDCASFILGMNKLFNLNLNKNEIINICKSLGADVVPCLYNSAVYAEGIGDIITKINTNFKYYIVIIKLDLSCNTGQMYRKLDEKTKNVSEKSNNKNIVDALVKKDIELLSDNLYNSFEKVVDVEKIKLEFKENKALGDLLSGSGSCVFRYI